MDYMNAPGRHHLFVPGPVNIPEQVIRAMNRNNEDYRSPAIPALTKTLLEDVKKIFKTTSGTPFMFPTTGTGAWESALTNTLSPGDRIVSFLIGQFSLLWIDQQKRLNFNVDVVESEWGQGANLQVLASKLSQDQNHSIKAICIVHNETATGVTNDISAVRTLLDHYKHPALLLVDGVSSICALDFRMDEWGVDVALTGSQKALSLPTGLGIVCASPKALEATKTSKSLKVFFDWNDYLKFYKLGTYWPYTPSIQLLYGLRAALDLIFEEGLENVIARHARLGKATRLAVEAWGLKNCTQKEEWISNTVTAVVVPPNIDSTEIVKRAWKRYNLSLGLGLNKVAGKVFRIGHLGNVNELQLLGCLAGERIIRATETEREREREEKEEMEKYLGNAYRGDPGVPHADADRFVNIWIGSAAFSVLTWFNPYMWQLSNQFNYHDKWMLFEQHHWKKARAKNQPYEFKWNKIPKEVRDSYYYNWPVYFP